LAVVLAVVLAKLGAKLLRREGGPPWHVETAQGDGRKALVLSRCENLHSAMNGTPEQEVASLARSPPSHASFESAANSQLSNAHNGSGYHHMAGRRWAIEPLLSNPEPLLINDKPLDEYAPLGQPDNAGRLGLALLLVSSVIQGLGMGSTVALAGRLSLRLEEDTEWENRGTGMSIEAPLISLAWGVALVVGAPLGGLLVDFRYRNVLVQAVAMVVWACGAGLLLLPVVIPSEAGPVSPQMSPPAVAFSWIGIGLCAFGAAMLRPLMFVLVADQVREQLERAQVIGLCFVCFAAGDVVASIVDAAGASAMALCLVNLVVLVIGLAALLAIRKLVALDTPLNPSAGLWDEFMPSGHGGSSEWSDDSLLSENGEPARSCCTCSNTVFRRLKRHPLVCGFGGQIDSRHVRTLLKVLLLAALVRCIEICVNWGGQRQSMQNWVCVAGAHDPKAPDASSRDLSSVLAASLFTSDAETPFLWHGNGLEERTLFRNQPQGAHRKLLFLPAWWQYGDEGGDGAVLSAERATHKMGAYAVLKKRVDKGRGHEREVVAIVRSNMLRSQHLLIEARGQTEGEQARGWWEVRREWWEWGRGGRGGDARTRTEAKWRGGVELHVYRNREEVYRNGEDGGNGRGEVHGEKDTPSASASVGDLCLLVGYRSVSFFDVFTDIRIFE